MPLAFLKPDGRKTPVCGGHPLEGSLGQPCGPCLEGKNVCVDNQVECVGGRHLTVPITGEGVVNAERDLQRENAELARDGLAETSWLYSGLEPDAVTWTWSAAARECLIEVLISPAAEEKSGAEEVIVEVIGADKRLVMTEKRPFKKVADTVKIELYDPNTKKLGVWGERIQLRFVGPECAACGFAEMVILAARAPAR